MRWSARRSMCRSPRAAAVPLVVLGLLTLAVPCAAEMAAPTATWSTTFASRYLFQGMSCAGDRGVVQPEMALSWTGLDAGIWANHDLQSNTINEYDVSLGITRSLGTRTTLGLTYMACSYPHAEAAATQELALDAGLSVFLEPALSVHYDFDEGKGVYSTLSLARGFGLSGHDVSLGMRLHHQAGYFAMTGIPAVEVGLSTIFAVAGLELAPEVARVEAFENGEFVGDSAVPDTWWCALTISPASDEE